MNLGSATTIFMAMRTKSITAGLLLTLTLSSAAWAFCPAPAPGNTADDIKANQQRLICLQQEASDAANRRQLQYQIDASNRQIQQLQLQRRLDSIPVYKPPKITIPAFD